MASRSCALRSAAADDDDCAEDVAPRPELLGDTKRGEVLALRYGENASLPAASSANSVVSKRRPAERLVIIVVHVENENETICSLQLRTTATRSTDH